MEKIVVKVCSKHGDLSEDEIKSGVYRGKKYRKCRHCELDRSRKYHEKLYQNPEWVAKKHAYDNQYWEQRKDEITERRQQPEKLQKRRDAYNARIDYHRERCNEKQTKYREDLHDSYIRKIIQDGNKDIKFTQIPTSLIELKRSIMMLKKGIKKKMIINMGNKINGNKNS